MSDPITPCGILNEAITPTIDDTETNTEDIIVDIAALQADITEISDDKLGAVSDFINVPYTGIATIFAYLHTGYYHIHGESFIAPYKAAPVTLTSAAAAWGDTGTIVEIIPAIATVKDFDLHWGSVSAISATLDGIIDIFAGIAGAEVKIGSCEVVRTINQSREVANPLMVPQQPAGTRISARFIDSTSSSRTARIKLYGHYYG